MLAFIPCMFPNCLTFLILVLIRKGDTQAVQDCSAVTHTVLRNRLSPHSYSSHSCLCTSRPFGGARALATVGTGPITLYGFAATFSVCVMRWGLHCGESGCRRLQSSAVQTVKNNTTREDCARAERKAKKKKEKKARVTNGGPPTVGLCDE